jgi:ubiquinone biosynthesis protein Coq4
MIQIPGLDINSFLKFAVSTYDTQSNFDLQKELIKSPNRTEAISYLTKSCEKSPEFMNLFKDNYMKRFPTTDELLAMPEDSLGYQVGVHLKTNNISLDFAGLDRDVFYNQELTVPAYLGIRGLRNHDVLHTLLDKDTSPISEYYIFAFQIAQFQSPLHTVSLAAGLLGLPLCHAIDPGVLLGEICQGFERGKKAKFVFGYPFEDHWHTPIEDVRKSLNL